MSAITTASERRHRRHLVASVIALIILIACPLFGHHLVPRLDAAMAGHDEMLGICLIALRQMLGPVHELFHVLILAGVAYGLIDRVLARREMPRLLEGLLATPLEPGSPLSVAARDAGLAPAAVRMVDGLPVPAFTVGWIRPRVYVSRALAMQLDDDQLGVVMAHEAAHVRRRDPLRLSLLRILSGTFFYVPALRSLAADMADEIEIAADDAAVGSRPERALVLASAIVSLAAWPRSTALPTLAAGFHNVALFERRVRRLAGEQAQIRSHVTRPCLACATVVLIALWVSGLVMAHPLPAQRVARGVTADYCWQEHASPWTHLFCHHAHARHHCPQVAARNSSST